MFGVDVQLVVHRLHNDLFRRVLRDVEAQLEFLVLAILLNKRRVESAQPARRGRRCQGTARKVIVRDQQTQIHCLLRRKQLKKRTALLLVLTSQTGGQRARERFPCVGPYLRARNASASYRQFDKQGTHISFKRMLVISSLSQPPMNKREEE